MSTSDLVNITNDQLALDKCDLSTLTDFAIDICHQHYFDPIQTMEILQHLNKLKDFRAYFNHRDHPSLSKILSDISTIIAQTPLSPLALPFLQEQLRIEKYYLGCNHPDLASVFFSIGQIYKKNDQLMESKMHFLEALSLLEKSKRKGQLYASVIYNIGLVNFRQSLYREALDNFNLAVIEHHAAYGEFHPTVADVCMEIGTLQLEMGKLYDAMDNCLQALVIIRMLFGNNHSRVAECLYMIGLIHEAKAEFSESLNTLSQALAINKNAQDVDDDDDDTLSLVILHRMGLIYQSIEDIDKSVEVFENLKNLIKLKAVDEDAEDRLLCSFGLNVDVVCFQQAAAAA